MATFLPDTHSMGAPIPLQHPATTEDRGLHYSRVVVIEATTRCNLACAFCAHDQRLPHPRTALAVEPMRQFLQLLGAHASQSSERVLVSWLGGEPLLAKAVVALTEEAKDTLPLRFSATTNGTRLSEAAVRDHIRRCYDELTVSVDGLAAFHDAMRGRAGVFKALKEGVQRLAAEAPALKLRANVVLMRHNFAEFPALCEELVSWGVQEVTFNQLGGRDRPEFYPKNRLTLEQAQQLPAMVAAAAASLSGAGIHLSYSTAYFHRILASASNEALPIRDCRPGQHYLFVNAQGRVAPCAFTTEEYGVELASLKVTSDIANISSMFAVRQREQQAPACRDCPCTNVHGKFS